MNKTAWKYALIPMIAVTLLAIYPQLTLWSTRGAAWKGSYFLSNYDESAYSAYVNSLIEGKPRKNDPFLGREDSPASPQPESLYSIQFIPAYAIAWPARLLGISALTAFIILTVLIAACAALAIFRLIFELSGDGLLSAVGALAVLCLGTAAAYQGEIGYWLRGHVVIDFFPFLRRYQPGFAFPLFFVFCLFAWRSFTQEGRRSRFIYSVFTGVLFAILVFSYFYLWTAAAAWMVCFVLVRLIWMKDARSGTLIGASIIGAIGVAALAPYFVMLSQRAQNLESVQLMVRTHAPNFASVSLMVGVLIAIAIFLAAKKGLTKINAPATLFALSFALTPILLINQQVVTGRSLQPIHYEIFISNYLVLTSLFLFLAAMFSYLKQKSGKLPFRKGLAYAAAIVLVWGFIEASASTKRYSVVAFVRDESIPVTAYIRDEEAAKPPGDRGGAVLATNFVTSDFIPSVAPARSLWNPHTSSAGGIDIAENKRLFYLFLYYAGFSEQDLGEALTTHSFEATAAVFGSERALPALGNDNRPILQQEIQAEVREYAEFVNRVDRATAANPTLSYVIVPAEGEPGLGNLDKWYQRDEGKTFGLFKVYRVSLKP
jgi:hypothetical protein